MTFNGAHRILAELPKRPDRPARPQWVHKAEEHQSHEPPKTNEPDDGSFDQEPNKLAHELKTKSDDFDQAISRLQYYINRKGDRLDPAEKQRLDRAKEALYRSYGRELPKNSFGS